MVIEDIKGNTTITRVRGAKISRRKFKYPDWGGVHISSTAARVKLGGSVEKREWTPAAGQHGGGGRGQG